ncbi:hypothetical protein [Neisseria sp.]|uniref:hypothetical protein n=1 Tax=Neisseria sp. TaxID=192066 RepID=UPI0026DD7C36|nr:hypothetical protein [Neisseria sp.]MDO4907991.1 hypothetical protein [Neisseria sp.]
MNRNTLRTVHLTAAATAMGLIVLFWTSTVISELFLSYQAVARLKQFIVYAMILMIASMALAGAAGMKMGGKSKHPKISAKRKRMPVIALNGLLVLVPCALFLNGKAGRGEFDGVFHAVQMVELIAGFINMSLMGLSMRDGKAIRKPKNG